MIDTMKFIMILIIINALIVFLWFDFRMSRADDVKEIALLKNLLEISDRRHAVNERTITAQEKTIQIYKNNFTLKGPND